MLPFELQVRVRELEAQRRDLLQTVEANNKTIASLMAERDALRIRVEEFEADLREGVLTYEHLREG
jgi:regulator of replication initiation timing